MGHRDATMILLAYRHRFRASELVDLRWNQIDFGAATLAVRRVKKGSPATHPIRGDELRAFGRGSMRTLTSSSTGPLQLPWFNGIFHPDRPSYNLQAANLFRRGRRCSPFAPPRIVSSR